MIPAQLSFRCEFTPVPLCGSVFVYMIPAQNHTLERVIVVRVHHSNYTRAGFSFQYENSFRRHVNKVRPGRSNMKSLSWESGTGSTCAVFDIQSNMASQS